MPAASSLQLQTPVEQRQVHYVSDNVFSLGTLSCAVCGHAFPIHTNAWQTATCTCCGTLHEPGAYSAFQRQLRAPRGTAGGVRVNNKVCCTNTAAAMFFTEKEVALATQYLHDSLGDELVGGATSSKAGAKGNVTKRAGQTEVDNRVIEDAFCETCGVHRPCKTFARQTRSADEGQTIFFQCSKCGSEWQQNS
ncbi:putative DNA-directed RNA polymerase I subunit [Leptomonas pyrrhocoris]|uniref:Putative DNA-directed RNA polymerase I subunit n=1 Tax=Leptomonas pyrrhocoris TaxID=157538 RepID=A0A0M9G3M0_LEPPY|nr:putative DNA-directed RNA polymerase I subunit [Leptomonas pyrrhocoris]XP_015659896.1 putative DNA-directed RNA polymerase I subunit [Leptomonas pyrrhocoris]KPA81456.1 putative DNA-directed RNA polymerase I subunit [Leptomonas pyrrhocoris]KPA81457.1 putative DNA-directed RNA polymerase I subunit [Leptomonas pyrrhocoris]|eukprot:XP_015659895.1 putative DNA-directed RNA polymerase I subunit [Leptomonas pyrrhocoris]